MNTFNKNNSLLAIQKSEYQYDPNKLVLVYDTTLGDGSNTIYAPVGGTVSTTIDWGDSTSNFYNFGGIVYASHTYSSPGIYVVQYSGSMSKLSHQTVPPVASARQKLIGCLSFGNIGLKDMFQGFSSCTNLTTVPSSLPSGWLSIYAMFSGCTNFNSPGVSSWDITNNIFVNQSLISMFANCVNFNQPLNNWNMTNVININSMFDGCTNFNQPLDNWDTSNIINMSLTFRNCINFNQDIGGWDVGNVSIMSVMLSNADSFSQNLANWDLKSIVQSTSTNGMNNFMNAATGLSTANYDATLIGWNNNKANFANNIRVHFGGSKYSAAGQAARSALVAYGWTITDGGLAP
jgi:surface protein